VQPGKRKNIPACEIYLRIGKKSVIKKSKQSTKLQSHYAMDALSFIYFVIQSAVIYGYFLSLTKFNLLSSLTIYMALPDTFCLLAHAKNTSASPKAKNCYKL